LADDGTQRPLSHEVEITTCSAYGPSGHASSDPDACCRDIAGRMREAVSIKDFFVEAPIKQPIDANIANLVPDTPEVRAESNRRS
jgi:hypothetical protein